MSSLRLPRATAATIDAQTLEQAEIVHDTTNDLVRVGDGSTAGGKALAYRDDVIDFLIGDYDDDLQDAIDAAYAYGSGRVVVDRDINLAATALLKDYVRVSIEPGVTITWTGGSSAMFSSASNGILLYAGIEGYGATLAMGASATKAVEVYGSWGGSFRGFRITGTLTTSIAIDLRGDASGGSNQVGGRHCAYNDVSDIVHYGVCGTFIRLYGTSTNSGYITLNTFNNVGCEEARVRGIDFAKWCDHNQFAGVTRIGIKGNNAIGVEYNSDTPASNLGVYANNFENLAVDTFSTYTNRIGVKINNAKAISIDYFYQYPVAEGGSLVTTSDTGAYRINFFKELLGKFQMLQNNVEVAGENALINPAFDINQRGTSFASGAIAYTSDRWKATRGSAAAGATFSRQTGFSGAQFCYRLARDNGNSATDILYFAQQIETALCYQYQGGEFYVGFDARAGADFSAASGVLSVTVHTGTGSNETVNVATGFATGNVSATKTATLTTTAQHFVLGPFDIASGVTEIAVVVSWTPVGTAGAADYAEVTRFSAGNLPTAQVYRPRPLEYEVAACERFFEKNLAIGTAPATNLGNGGVRFRATIAGANDNGVHVPFRVRKRTTPTVTLYNPNAANNEIRDVTAAANFSSSTANQITQTGFQASGTGNAATAVGNQCEFHWGADCEIGP